ncbi:hypothetical protein RKD39_001183 [Streptomyces albogriseolus]
MSADSATLVIETSPPMITTTNANTSIEVP